MKRFLLTAGDHYYPEAVTGDWIACFTTEAEAEATVTRTEVFHTYKSGPRKGQKFSNGFNISINGRTYDWYEIIDLSSWIDP